MSRVYGDFVDFWENGINWMGVQGVSIPDQARLLYYWNELRLDSTEIEDRVDGIRFPIARKKIEQGEEAYLDWFWQQQIRKDDARFGQLIELLASHDRTCRLVSYIELRDLCLSRSIGEVNGVMLNDLPRIRITDEWEFEVRTPAMAVAEYNGEEPREFLGKGNAHEAFEIVLQNLPPDLGPAQYQRSNHPAA